LCHKSTAAFFETAIDLLTSSQLFVVCVVRIKHQLFLSGSLAGRLPSWRRAGDELLPQARS
jgi:hypothetical protein